jgi:UPF0755 protein
MRKVARLVVAVALVVAAGVATLYVRIHEPYRGYPGAEQFVDIPSGLSSRAIGERLVAAGVVRDSWTFRVALWVSGQAREQKAGEYRFAEPLAPHDVIGKIARGDAHLVSVTFPEGLTITEMASIFASHRLGPASAFIEAAGNVALVHGVDPAAQSLEGYLFPETYAVTRGTDAARLVRLMVKRFEDAFSAELRQTAEARGLSVRAVTTLASIVEKETARSDERPVVAAVYQNRLRIGMPLQCDPTLIYALQMAGKYTGNLRREHKMFDSPYNTYRYAGLPPGPIASPGRASLESVVHPAKVDYLYFVSRNDGSHEFARTLAEHSRNVQRYQVDYYRSPHFSFSRRTSK